MVKYRLLARGNNFLGQLGIPNRTFFESWQEVPDLTDIPIKKITTNFGQSFVQTKSGMLIRRYLLFWLGF